MMSSRGIDRVLARAASEQEVPGVVAIAATDHGVIYEGAFGKRELGGDAAMTPDTVGFIASMTKPITAVAVMQLVERGKLKLDDPAAKVVSDLARVQVLAGFDAAGKPILRPPKRAVTLRQLLTHTSGFGYEIWNADLVKYQLATGTPSIFTCKNAALPMPLLCDPGERWVYGIGIDWAGKMVEAASGQRLGDYFRSNIFDPLGMNGTSFALSLDQRRRLASVHARTPDGSLATLPFEFPQEPEFQQGGGGLYGTMQDYLRFTQMILHAGRFNGNQLLEAATVRMMSRNQIGDIDCGELKTAMPRYSNDVDLLPGSKPKWGLSFLINTEPTPQGRSAGSLAWAGLTNSFFWIDHGRRVTGAFMTQIFPFFDRQAVRLFQAFESAVYQSQSAPGAPG